MVPVIVLKASRETVQQYPVMKRNHHQPEKEDPGTKKTLNHETPVLSGGKGEGVHTQTVKKAKFGPKMTRNNTELRDCPQAAIK